MSKINKTKYGIFLSLGILTVLALGITVSPAETNAYTTKYDRLINRDSSYNREETFYVERPIIHSLSPNPIVWGSSTKSITIYGENFVYGAVARLNGSDRTTTFLGENTLEFQLVNNDASFLGDHVITVYGPGGGLSNGYILSVKNKLATVNIPSTIKNSTTTSTKSNNTDAQTTDETTNSEKESLNDLAASAIFGGGGFFPSGLVQWILLAIFVLLLIILARKMFAEKKYHETPLKHA